VQLQEVGSSAERVTNLILTVVGFAGIFVSIVLASALLTGIVLAAL
jgi:hypothetical protein